MKSFGVPLLFFLIGCADVASHSKSTMSDGATVHAFRCENNWDACYRAAEKACGAAGFTELERLPDVGSTANEQLEALRRADDGVHSRQLPADGMRHVQRDGTLTVRCNEP